MKHSVITTLGLLFKRLTGIRDVSTLRKDVHKCLGSLIYHKTYTADDIVEQMIEMGMKRGSVVCIHAAMKEFYNYRGTALELIEKITEAITSEGTLIMPAFPDPKVLNDDNFIFDSVKEPTKAGFLAETFRQFPGVKRSINVQHSVCAWGKYAEWLTQGHNQCVNCWDENSPWYRMTLLDAIVFTLGMPFNYIGTFDHCVEGTLYKEHDYWRSFFNEERTFRYYDNQHNICTYKCMYSSIEKRTRELRLIKHFSSNIFKHARISNLLIKAFNSRPCLDKMIALGKQGITMFYVPSPRGYKF